MSDDWDAHMTAHRSDHGLIHSGPRETCVSMDCLPSASEQTVARLDTYSPEQHRAGIEAARERLKARRFLREEAPGAIGCEAVARYADGDGEHGRGKVISYSVVPTFTIERPDGTRFDWRYDLCDIEEADE